MRAPAGRSGTYHRESVGGDKIGHRGVGMYGDWLYFTTPEAHLISLNAKDGTVRWEVELADYKLGYFATVAPLVIRNHVIVGVSGDVTDIPGIPGIDRSGDRQGHSGAGIRSRRRVSRDRKRGRRKVTRSSTAAA